jgi:hypothetical protein
MDQHPTGTSEVLAFAPTQKPSHESHLVDAVTHRNTLKEELLRQ